MSRTAASTMRLATGPGIFDPSRQPSLGDFLHVTGAASNDLDSVACQEAHRPSAHISGQHHRYSHAGKLWDDVRLTSTTGRGSQSFLRYDLVLVIDIKDREALAMSKVLIDLCTVGW